MFSVKPPRRVLDFTYSANFVSPLTVSWWAYTFRIPPVCSLPQVIAPQLPFITQFTTTRFWHGTFTRRPSASRPDLIAMLSSCAPRLQFAMTTWSHDSGSQPSVLECAVLGSVVTPSTVTLRHSVGCSCQNIEFFRVTPWISTFSQSYGSTNAERMVCPEPGTTRFSGAVPLATSVSRYARSLPLFHDDVAAASSVPLPVRPMFFSRYA